MGETAKKGLIIYTNTDVDKNKTFVDICTEKFKEYGITLKLAVIEGDLKISTMAQAREIFNNIEELAAKDVYSFAINRSRDVWVARYLEMSGVRVFNNSLVTSICNNKWETYNYVKSIGVDVLKTLLINPEQKDKRTLELGYPRVVKSLDGHGGTEVFLVKDERGEEEAATIIGKDYIVQNFADAKGRDVRAYVLGGQIVVALCREAKDTFKSNFSLGGDAHVYEMNGKEKEMVLKVASELGIDYGGIDFFYDGNRLVLNEIEDAVGARMVYANTNINIIEKYVAYIRNKIFS